MKRENKQLDVNTTYFSTSLKSNLFFFIIGELSEKLITAVVLKNISPSSQLERAIKKAVEDSGIEPENGLSHQDVFYREVTRIYRGLQKLVAICEETAHSDLNPTEFANLLCETNEIILVCFNC